MRWLSYFSLGLVLGGVLVMGVRFGLARDRFRPGVPTMLALLLGASTILLAFGAHEEVAAYPLGLLAACLVSTLDVAIRNAERASDQTVQAPSRLRTVVGWTHLVAALIFVFAPIALFVPSALDQLWTAKPPTSPTSTRTALDEAVPAASQAQTAEKAMPAASLAPEGQALPTPPKRVNQTPAARPKSRD